MQWPHPYLSSDFGQIAQELIGVAIATDEAEDQEFGEARGDELPEELQSDEGRRAWLARELAARRQAKREDEDEGEGEDGQQTEYEFDAEQIVARVQGRDGWLLDAKRQLDRDRWQTTAAVRRGREGRLWDAAERLEQDLAALRAGNEAYQRGRHTFCVSAKCKVTVTPGCVNM